MDKYKLIEKKLHKLKQFIIGSIIPENKKIGDLRFEAGIYWKAWFKYFKIPTSNI